MKNDPVLEPPTPDEWQELLSHADKLKNFRVDAINKIEILRKNRDYGAMEDPRISQWTDFVAEIDKALEQAELASWTEKMEKASPAEALKLREFACNQLLGEARTLVLNERVNIAENILRTRGIKWEPDPGE